MLLFVHDDIVIDHPDKVLTTLEKSFEDFDILGLAGTASWVLGSPAVWHKSDQNKWSGSVRHADSVKSWITNFGPIGQKCVIVDGLFMAFRKDQLGDLRFDPQFTFHHYDMDFCLSAFLDKLKVGTTPIMVTHYSVGEYRGDPIWIESESKFLNKWQQ